MSAVFDEGVPNSIVERAKNIVLDLLPKKSRGQYEKEYTLFQNWKERKVFYNYIVIFTFLMFNILLIGVKINLCCTLHSGLLIMGYTFSLLRFSYLFLYLGLPHKGVGTHFLCLNFFRLHFLYTGWLKIYYILALSNIRGFLVDWIFLVAHYIWVCPIRG